MRLAKSRRRMLCCWLPVKYCRHRADGVGLAGAEVNLQPALPLHSSAQGSGMTLVLTRAVDQHLAHLGKLGQTAAQLLGAWG